MLTLLCTDNIQKSFGLFLMMLLLSPSEQAQALPLFEPELQEAPSEQEERKEQHQFQRHSFRASKKQFRNSMKRFRQLLTPPQLLLKHADQLNLTQDQKRALKLLIKESKINLKTLSDAQIEPAKQFDSALKLWELDSNDTNESALLQIKADYLEKERLWRNERLKTALKARKILKPEQSEILNTLRSQRENKKQVRKERRMRRKGSQKHKDREQSKEHREHRRLERFHQLEERLKRLEDEKANSN